MQFLLPVIDQRSRADHQRSPGSALRIDLHLLGQKDRDRLQGFTQSHVVSQNTAESIGVQHPHPPVADDLIFAQGLPEAGRYIEVRV